MSGGGASNPLPQRMGVILVGIEKRGVVFKWRGQGEQRRRAEHGGCVKEQQAGRKDGVEGTTLVGIGSGRECRSRRSVPTPGL